jgi:hypothetical protein
MNALTFVMDVENLATTELRNKGYNIPLNVAYLMIRPVYSNGVI